MIKNDKQYQVTKNRLSEFNKMLTEVLNSNDIDPIYKKIEEDSIKSQISQFEKELKEYEFLKKGDVCHIYIDNLSSIPEALIKARIVKRWTQADLAKKLSLKEQQIQRYELSDYSTASINRITEIASALGISMKKIKVDISQPVFNLSEEFVDEGLNLYEKIREKRSLFAL